MTEVPVSAAPAAPSPPVPPSRHARPGRSAEARSWVFMRLSGLALVLLSLTHFAITHIVNDVVATDSDFVADRWDNPLWRAFDWLLLSLALTHGMNGVRVVIDDYIRNAAARRAVKAVVYGLVAFLFVLGTFTVASFD